MKRKDSRNDIDFYLDHELVEIWKGLDRLMFDDNWRRKVFLARMLLGLGLRLQESLNILTVHCAPEYAIVEDGKGHITRYVDPIPVFTPYYQEFVLWRRATASHHRPLVTSAQRSRVKAMGPRIGRYWWYEVLEELKVRPISPHGARRTHATWVDSWFLPAYGWNPGDTQAQLGHTDKHTTQAHYSRSIPGRKFSRAKPAWVEFAEDAGEKLRTKYNVMPWVTPEAMAQWEEDSQAFMKRFLDQNGRRKSG
jgi:integrase